MSEATPQLDFEQRQRAALIAESRGIDDDTAHELVWLRDSHDALVAALAETLNVMEIQEQRETEAFHLSITAFRPMWDAAKDAARAALTTAKQGTEK